MAASFWLAPPRSLVAVLAQRAPARSFSPDFGGKCLLRRRVSGLPRVPSSFARPELSCSWRPERRGRVALGGPGGGRPCPARGRTRHKALYAVPPGPPDDRPFPPQADPPELDSVSRRAAASDPSAGMLSVFIEGRPRPRGRREDRGSRPVFVEPLQSFRIALSCALLRLLRYFKRLTQKGKGMLHKTQRGGCQNVQII